jgi:hypothetical protein
MSINLAFKYKKKSKVKNKFKIKSDTGIQNIELHNKTAKMLENKFPTVFDKTFSAIKNFESYIQVKSDAIPCFTKPYDVPYAILDSFEKELDSHIKDVVLLPVKYSEWASPLVPVPKEGRGIRICDDLKSTLNPQLKTDQYPLPLFSQMSHNWAGCKFFSKIDLKKAYLQLNVHPDSQKFLTVNTHKG